MRLLVGFVLLILLLPCIAVQGHTPNVMMSILKEDGPAPADIVETAGFVEGDGVKSVSYTHLTLPTILPV